MTNATRVDPASAEAPRRRAVTILFSDLSESTRIAGSLEAEDYSDLLDRLRAIYHRAVAEHDGLIAQISGDGMLAVFGYPETREDDARRAVETALDLRHDVRAVADEERWRSLALRLHSGIHSGDVLFSTGDDVRGRFELLGWATNVASRLCAHAGPDQILVSDTTLGPERHLFFTGRRRDLQLRGKNELVPTLSILGRAPGNSRYAASERAGLTPFIGREVELQRLTCSLEQVVAGAGLFLKIRGDAGEGKTRLAEELLHHAAERRCPVHRGECNANAEPLQPFLQIARSIFGIGSQMPPEEATRRVEAILGQLGPALLAHRPALLRLLALSSGKAGPEETNAAMRALLESLAGQEPLILFIDDWHDADDASRAMRAALRDVGSLFILVTTRSGEARDVDLDGEILELHPLSDSETLRAASLLLPSPDPFVLADIRASSGGTPLFIEEMCHSIESGQADKRPSDRMAWLRALIRSRFSRLSQEQADLVRVASVIGNPIPAWLFALICERDPGDPLVAELAAADFIFPGEREGTLRFKHGLAREILYESVGKDERTILHLRIAEALRSRGPEPGEEEPIEALAYHFAEGGQAAEAADYAQRSGDKAAASSALDRAQAQYRAALVALERLPATDENARRWDRIAQDFGLAGVFDPSPDQLEVFERAVERAGRWNDKTALARARYWLGYINYALGEPLAAIPHCERALEAALAVNDDPLAVQIGAVLGQAKAAACDYAGALVLLDEAIEVKRRHRTGAKPPIGFAYSLSCKAFALGDMGRFAEAHACFEEAMAAVGGARHEVKVSVLNQHAVVCLWERRFEEAVLLAGKGMEEAEQARSYYSHAMSRSIRAYARWSTERDPAAIQTIVEATAWLEATKRGQFTSLNYGWLAEQMVAEGRWREGCRYAARALHRARKHDRLGEAMALRAMARAAAAGGWPRPPAHYLDRAREAARVRNSPHELAMTDLCRAELALQAGDPSAEQALLQARLALSALEVAKPPASGR